MTWPEAIGRAIAFIICSALIVPWILFVFKDLHDENLFNWKHTRAVLRFLLIGAAIFIGVGSVLVFGVAGLLKGLELCFRP